MSQNEISTGPPPFTSSGDSGNKATGYAAGHHRSAFIGRLLLQVSQRLRRSKSLALFKHIEKAPFVSPEEIAVRQFALLSKLLAHAEKRVPYYREVFRSLGISSRDIRNLDDFAKMPILTKQIIRNQQKDLIRDDVPT